MINSSLSMVGTMTSAWRCSRIAGRRCHRQAKWWSWRWCSQSIRRQMSSRRARSWWTWTCSGSPQAGRTGPGGSTLSSQGPRGSTIQNTFCVRTTYGWSSFTRKSNDRDGQSPTLSLMMVSLCEQKKFPVVRVFSVVDGETIHMLTSIGLVLWNKMRVKNKAQNIFEEFFLCIVLYFELKVHEPIY